jgi:purine-binding chemotaxis protein CheW
MRPLPVEPVAGAPSFVLGLAVIRGQPTPVIDAARLLSSGANSVGRPAPDPVLPDATAPDPVSMPARRFVTLRVGERTVALALDAVLEVRLLPPELLNDTPSLLGSGTESVSALGALDTQLLLVLEAGRLIPESLLTALAPERASA